MWSKVNVSAYIITLTSVKLWTLNMAAFGSVSHSQRQTVEACK